MSATTRSGAITGPGRLRTTATASPSTSTSASEISISFTLIQNPVDTGPKLSSKPVSEKNDSTTLLTPGEAAIRPATAAKNTTVLTVEMIALRRREPPRLASNAPLGGWPPGPPAPCGSTRAPKPIPDMRLRAT